MKLIEVHDASIASGNMKVDITISNINPVNARKYCVFMNCIHLNFSTNWYPEVAEIEYKEISKQKYQKESGNYKYINLNKLFIIFFEKDYW